VQIASGTVIAGKYVLEAPVGQGGMGSVWRARHLKLHSEVAVKFMDPSIAASAAARERFEREARASARIDYLHIARVHDYGIENNLPYIVMELLRGESLEERLKRQFRLPISEIVPIATQIGKALRKAHEAGYVHRDLKPGNIFLVKSEDDDDQIIKLLDFGIAKETAAAAVGSTKTGEFMGSPHYMSPEQIQDSRAIDQRSDLWSLGVILFRAVTGALPFPGDTIGAVLGKVLTAPVPPPASYVRGLPEGIDAFFQKALARDRAARFQSAREMADAFASLTGAHVPAGPGRRGSSAPWIQRDSLMASSSAPQKTGHFAGPHGQALPPRATDSGMFARPSQPSSPHGQALPHGATDSGMFARPSQPSGPPAEPGQSAPTPVARGGQTVKMTPFRGPAPDPGPPKELPDAQTVVSGGRVGPGTLTVSPSTGDIQPGGGEQRHLWDRIRALPVGVMIAAGAVGAVALLLTLLIVLTAPSEGTEGERAAAALNSRAAGAAAEGTPGGTPNGADNGENPTSAQAAEEDPSKSATGDPKSSLTSSNGQLPKAPNDKGIIAIRVRGGTCAKLLVNSKTYTTMQVDAVVDPGLSTVSCLTENGPPKVRTITLSAGQTKPLYIALP